MTSKKKNTNKNCIQFLNVFVQEIQKAETRKKNVMCICAQAQVQCTYRHNFLFPILFFDCSHSIWKRIYTYTQLFRVFLYSALL